MAASGEGHTAAKVVALFVAVLGGSWLLDDLTDGTLSAEATATLVFALLLVPVAAVAIPLLRARAQEAAGRSRAEAALRRDALAALADRAEVADTEPVIRASTGGLLIEVEIHGPPLPAVEVIVRSATAGAFAPLGSGRSTHGAFEQVHDDRARARMAGRPTRAEIGQLVDAVLRVAGQRWMHADSPLEHLERLAGEGDRLAAEALAIRRGAARPADAHRWLLASTDPAARRRAASLLPTSDLLVLADDADLAPAARGGAIEGLAGRPVVDLAERIGRWLDHEALRDAALRLLVAAEVSAPALAPRLRALIPAGGGGYADAQRLEAVAAALGRIADPANTDPLLLLNEHPASAVRRAALRALAAVGTPAALPRLLRSMETDDSPEMTAAVAAIRGRAAAGAGGLAVAPPSDRGGLAVAEEPPPG